MPIVPVTRIAVTQNSPFLPRPILHYMYIMYVAGRQSNALLVREGQTACIECRVLADPRPDVFVYHGTTTSHELGAPGRHGGPAVTRAGVGVERYVDVASGGVAVAAYTFPGAGDSDEEGSWSVTTEVPRLRAGAYHCVANNTEATEDLRFTVRLI